MQLKKINSNLQQALVENGFTEPNEMQYETFSTLKSGADAVIQSAQKSGKTTTLVLNVIQRLEKPLGESTRALILVQDKEQTLNLIEQFKRLGKYNNLRIIGCHDKTDIDEDKNTISAGMDVLIGTPNKINAMFSSAGFNMNTIKMFVADDVDVLCKQRADSIILRLSMSLEKAQRLFFCTEITSKVEILADKIMIEPVFFQAEEQ